MRNERPPKFPQGDLEEGLSAKLLVSLRFKNRTLLILPFWLRIERGVNTELRACRGLAVCASPHAARLGRGRSPALRTRRRPSLGATSGSSRCHPIVTGRAQGAGVQPHGRPRLVLPGAGTGGGWQRAVPCALRAGALETLGPAKRSRVGPPLLTAGLRHRLTPCTCSGSGSPGWGGCGSPGRGHKERLD